MKACADDAAPRWRGNMSSSASVRIGNTRAMPNAVIAIGSTANGNSSGTPNRLNCSGRRFGASRFKAMFIAAAAPPIAQPMFAMRSPLTSPPCAPR